MAEEKDWFVYIVETEDGRFYTGVSTDVERRFERHKKGPGGGGAKFFALSPPKNIRYREKCASRSEALRREAVLKGLDRKGKLALMNSGPPSRP